MGFVEATAVESRSEANGEGASLMKPHPQAWSLHDAVTLLARERGLSDYRVECLTKPTGETLIILVLPSSPASA